jgi:hypothetical protein
MPASTTADGMATATAPNVCQVQVPPPVNSVPTPFPSIAQLAKASPTLETVLIENKPIVVASSKVAQTSGDEAGTLGGVVSGTNMGEASFTTASSKVFVGSAKVVHLLATTSHNGNNAPSGLVSTPSQQKVFVAT